MRQGVLLMVNENGIHEEGETVVELITKTASDIVTQEIIWTWYPFLPQGSATLLIGDGGSGKSFATCALAAAISTGRPLPGMETAMPPSDVIIQNTENGWSTVIKPRLDMLGADCSRIHFIDDSQKRLTLTDSRIEAAIRKHNAKLLVLDPWQSMLDQNFSMNRSESVRPALMHLEKVAQRTQSTILLVGHIGKSRGKAQHRSLGSVDLVNAVPSALCLGRAAELDPDVRCICHLKGNFSSLGPAILFRLNKDSGFSWIGTDEDITPDDIMNFNAAKSKEDKGKLNEAVDFIYDVLSGTYMPAAEFNEMAAEMDIADKTLERARKKAGVKSRKIDGIWTVFLEGEDD